MILYVRSLDVWGNATDGFDVNDSFAAGKIEVADDASDDNIIQSLIDEGFLKETAKALVELENDGNAMQETRTPLRVKETGEPLYWLDGQE